MRFGNLQVILKLVVSQHFRTLGFRVVQQIHTTQKLPLLDTTEPVRFKVESPGVVVEPLNVVVEPVNGVVVGNVVELVLPQFLALKKRRVGRA